MKIFDLYEQDVFKSMTEKALELGLKIINMKPCYLKMMMITYIGFGAILLKTQ